MKIGILAKVKSWADKKNEQIFFQITLFYRFEIFKNQRLLKK